ncbi:MAG: iron-sulfur cluster assembly scaffold protein [Sphingomonadales bacterium]|nr:iron-sulfur cluster assembly scaffold protein [Sphingomonadales bacterium]
MASATRLYTPDILALAVELARFPLDPAMPLQGSGRSPSCGSSLTLSLACDGAARITALGARAQACAIGQASTALFLAAAPGRSAAEIAATRDQLRAWLANGAAMPDWPGLDRLLAAREFPARHGAIMLPWNAALDALSPG